MNKPDSGCAAGASSGWREYDFRPGARELAPAEAERLRVVQAESSRTVAARLTGLLRRRVEVHPVDVAQVATSELEVAEPTEADRVHQQLVRAEALRDVFLLRLPAPFLLAAVETLLGAAPAASPRARRFTRLERDLADSVRERLVSALEASWADGDRPLGLGRAASSVEEYLAGLRPGARLTRLSFQLEMAGGGGPMELVLAHGPLLGRLTEAVGHTGDEPRARLDPRQGALGALEVCVAAEVTTRALPLVRLLGLEPGDVIDTGVPLDAPVGVTLEGQAFQRGRFGVHRGRTSVRLT